MARLEVEPEPELTNNPTVHQADRGRGRGKGKGKASLSRQRGLTDATENIAEMAAPRRGRKRSGQQERESQPTIIVYSDQDSSRSTEEDEAGPSRSRRGKGQRKTKTGATTSRKGQQGQRNLCTIDMDAERVREHRESTPFLL